MARTSTFVDATPEAVFEVLATPAGYGRAAAGDRSPHTTGSWPEPGSSLVVDLGRGPLRVPAMQAVTAVDAPSRFVVEGRGPGLQVEVELQVRPRFGATLVTLHERARGGPAARVPAPLLDVALRLRGRRVLARLRGVAEARLRRG